VSPGAVDHSWIDRQERSVSFDGGTHGGQKQTEAEDNAPSWFRTDMATEQAWKRCQRAPA